MSFLRNYSLKSLRKMNGGGWLTIFKHLSVKIQKLFTLLNTPNKYHAFVSYKHITSTELSKSISSALRTYATYPWKPRKIFRDEEHLVPSNSLPAQIVRALESSNFLIFLASPEAAKSEWVQDELSRWFERQERRKRFIIILTDGTIEINKKDKTIIWEKTNALPSLLKEFLREVPLFIDLKRTVGAEKLTVDHPDFQSAINSIIACIQGKDKNYLFGEEQRIRRKIISGLSFAVLAFAALTIFAGYKYFEANEQRIRADIERDNAEVALHGTYSRFQYNGVPDIHSFAKTIENIKSLSKVNPSYSRYRQFGMILEQNSSRSQAEEAYTNAINMRPDYSSGYAHRASARMSLGKYLDAIDDLNTAIELQPEIAAYYDLRAEALLKINKWVEAEKDRIYADTTFATSLGILNKNLSRIMSTLFSKSLGFVSFQLTEVNVAEKKLRYRIVVARGKKESKVKLQFDSDVVSCNNYSSMHATIGNTSINTTNIEIDIERGTFLTSPNMKAPRPPWGYVEFYLSFEQLPKSFELSVEEEKLQSFIAIK